jgi:ribose transport system permease protein
MALGVVLAVLACIGIAMVADVGPRIANHALNMQPFIVTLCGLLFYRGLARFITNDETKGFGTVAGLDFLRYLANGNLAGIPMPFVLLLIIAVITWVVLHRSVYGRYLFATGRNAEAARYAGINTKWIITLTYVIAGALTAISGMIFAFYTNSVSPANHGNAYELYGIAAAVLGGCSLRGGEGSVVGILIGTALLQVLRNLVNLLGIPSSLDFAVMGAVILIGVMADQIFTERRNRRQVALMRESQRVNFAPLRKNGEINETTRRLLRLFITVVVVRCDGVAHAQARSPNRVLAKRSRRKHRSLHAAKHARRRSEDHQLRRHRSLIKSPRSQRKV